jgi:hypothetical protein
LTASPLAASLPVLVTSRFLALLLVFSIWPATGEMIEHVVHWAEYGDTAHGAGDPHEGAPLGTDEHGCSGMFHLCSCHTGGQVATPQLATLTVALASNHREPVPAPTDGTGCEDPAPAIRPPIA